MIGRGKAINYAFVLPYSFNIALCRIDDSVGILGAPSSDNKLQLLVNPNEGIYMIFSLCKFEASTRLKMRQLFQFDFGVLFICCSYYAHNK